MITKEATQRLKILQFWTEHGLKATTDAFGAKRSTNKHTFKNFLKLGQTSEEVKQLQTKLKTLGYFTYPKTTGYFGPVTETAVKAFQKANNIPPLGYVGPATRTALNKK